MTLDDRLHDRQAQAAAAGRAKLGRPRFINFVEPIEDARQVLGRNARPSSQTSSATESPAVAAAKRTVDPSGA